MAAAHVTAQVPSPRSVLGFNPTDDRTIADWNQITDYFAKLDVASNRVTVKEVGRSTLGKSLIVAFISSPSNIKNLEKYRRISAKLADPRMFGTQTPSSADVDRLIDQGKTIVVISCSIHSTEIVASQMSMNLAYELATANDSDTNEILENTILLLIPSPNPDGIQIVADWYRKTLNTKSEGTSPPELYHRYAGHDDNRDWFMMNLKETQAITKLLWQEWFPQIVYDVHQQGETGSRFILPPFYDPSNPRVPPAILRDVGAIGYKMAADLQAKGIAGIATNSTYDTWWHGGFRTVPYFHNSIGILSEAASADLMSPITITEEQLKKARPVRGLPNLFEAATNYPDPWKGGTWRPADIANIEVIASRSLLEMAAKFRQRYLRQFHDLNKAATAPRTDIPQAFIVTAGQPNTEAVSRFLEILMWQGIEVYRMTNELYVKMEPAQKDFHEMPLGSFIVFTDQPQRTNVLTLFERQEYPHRLLPNGEAEAPYDVAGWTLPLQMGLSYDPVWEIRNREREASKLRRVENINQAREVLNLEPAKEPFQKLKNPLKSIPRIGLYKSYTASMDEGWTRLVFDNFQIPYRSVVDNDIRRGNLELDVIVLPADSEKTIVQGLSAERYPAEFAGGIGEDGVANLKKFVENGGKLVCFDDSCEIVIKHFGLPIRNVLSGLKRSEFYNPGSIVKLGVNTQDPFARGLPDTLPAYFSTSSAFEIDSSRVIGPTVREGSTNQNGALTNVRASDTTALRIVARYAERDALLSGWMLGEKYLNGKAALVVTGYGKGKIVLFAFRPQHRGQTWATFPLIFTALEE